MLNVMHSIKGVWGRTFAFAKHNESEGRKTRIRRSKEERKAMVESFIKKYQQSNNGNFPSLNLTHKEVGGSFYTVREIVRDIIQENRVLGPAKFTLEELNTDQFSEQYPLGSIARDPQPILALNENHPKLNKVKDTNGKMLSVFDGHDTEAQYQMVDKGHVKNAGHVDVTDKEAIEATVVSDGYNTGTVHPMVDPGHVVNGSEVDVTNESVEASVVGDGFCTGAEEKIVDEENVVNVSQVEMKSKESNEATIPKMQVSEPTASKQNVEQELAATTTPGAKVTAVTENMIVETFPLRSVTRITDGKEVLEEFRDSSNSPEKNIKMLELDQGEEKSVLTSIEPTKSSNLVDEKSEDALGNKKLKKISNTEHDEEEKSPGDTEGTDHSTHKELLGHESENSIGPQVKVSHQNTVNLDTNNQSLVEDLAKTSIQDGSQDKNLNKTSAEGSKPSDDGLHKADKHRVDHQHSGNSQIRSNTTVDRINLESWGRTPKNSAKQEPNPLVAMLKAVVNEFVKFWSE